MSNIQTFDQSRRNKLTRIHSIITAKASQIERALPKGGLTAERMVRIVLTAVSTNKSLWECSEESLIAAVMQAAQLGLEPDGILGMASLVPFGNKVQLVIGYRGYIQLALRSGAVKDVRTRCVFDGDLFEVSYGLDETIKHVPARANIADARMYRERGQALSHLSGDPVDLDPEPEAVYGVALFTNGGNHFEVLWPEDVARIRASSKAWKHPDSPWQKHRQAMWRKTAVKQTLKYCPLASEDAGWVRKAEARDEQTFAGFDLSDDGVVVSEEDLSAKATQEQVPAQLQPQVATAPVTAAADVVVPTSQPSKLDSFASNAVVEDKQKRTRRAAAPQQHAAAAVAPPVAVPVVASRQTQLFPDATTEDDLNSEDGVPVEDEQVAQPAENPLPPPPVSAGGKWERGPQNPQAYHFVPNAAPEAAPVTAPAAPPAAHPPTATTAPAAANPPRFGRKPRPAK
jgi:recombination protein RecT